jgi:hypothetical protein
MDCENFSHLYIYFLSCTCTWGWKSYTVAVAGGKLEISDEGETERPRPRPRERERERERGRRLRVRKVKKKKNRKQKTKKPFDSISRVRVVQIGDLNLGKMEIVRIGDSRSSVSLMGVVLGKKGEISKNQYTQSVRFRFSGRLRTQMPQAAPYQSVSWSSLPMTGTGNCSCRWKRCGAAWFCRCSRCHRFLFHP